MMLARLKQLSKPILKPALDMVRRQLRLQQLREEKPQVTQQMLIDDLERLSLPPEPLVLVHTSLKQLGFVEGGAASVVEALIDVVLHRRRGTLALPCFSIDGSMHNTLVSGRIFDVRSTPCNLGAIPEMFRRHPNVRRSIHPTHSIAAIGPKAEWLTRDHHLCGSNFGQDSPMARIMAAGGWLMGLGTGLGTVTFYHCLEDIEDDFPLSVYSSDSPLSVFCIDWHGIPHVCHLPAHAADKVKTRIDYKDSEPLRKFFAKRLENFAGLHWFDIGQGHGWIVPMQDMYTECRKLMHSGITIYTAAEELEHHAEFLR